MSWQPQDWQPEGWQPDGWQPDSGVDVVAYPDGIPANRSIRLPAGGIWVVDPDVESWCEIDFSGSIQSGVTLSSVARTLPTGLTEVSAVTDTTDGRFAIKISGAAHASMHQIAIVATLSNADTISVTAPLRCFNG